MKLSLNWVGLGLVAALATTACSTDDTTTDDATGGTGGGNTPIGGTGGTGATAGTEDPGIDKAFLGKACSSDGECGGLHCVTNDGGEYAGDAAPNGVCVADCVADEGALCEELEGSCIQFDEAGAVTWCVEVCEPNTAAEPVQGQPMDPNFCHGRLDHSCRPLENGAACLPTCNNHGDCGEFWCDVGTGFCVADEPVGDPIGTPCSTDIIDPDIPEENKPTDTCAGRCIGQVDAEDNLVGATCSGYCTSGTIGAVVNCGSVAGEIPHAACLWVFDANAGAGDFGACGQLCECNTDCLDPSAGCEDFASGTQYTEDQFRQVFGQAGYCRNTPDNPRTDCP